MGGFVVLLSLALSAPLAEADLGKGKKVYVDICQVCHGERGDGQTFVANALNPPPRNFTSKISKKELSRARMIRSATHGRPGTAMMPWKNRLTPAEIRAVVDYIRQEFMGLRE
jgi:mono/diheme cytochrome c family protein